MFANGRQNRLLGSQSNHALPNITHRRHAEGFAKHARRAAAVRYGNNRSNVERPLSTVMQFSKPSQQNRETGATTNPDNLHRPSPFITTPIVLSRIRRSRLSEMCLA